MSTRAIRLGGIILEIEKLTHPSKDLTLDHFVIECIYEIFTMTAMSFVSVAVNMLQICNLRSQDVSRLNR